MAIAEGNHKPTRLSMGDDAQNNLWDCSRSWRHNSHTRADDATWRFVLFRILNISTRTAFHGTKPPRSQVRMVTSTVCALELSRSLRLRFRRAGEDGVQPERSEFIVRAWTPFAASRKDGLAGEERD